MDILDTFTINVSGRMVDGLCRAPAERPSPPKFGATLTDTQTEANALPRSALTMSTEGFGISRKRGKGSLELE